MIRYVVVAVLLVGCGGDRCEKVYDKLAPAMEKEMKGKPLDKAKMVGKCKDDLKAHPEQAKMLDCILAISGTPSIEDLSKCSEQAGKGSFEDYKNKSKMSEASLQLNKIGKRAKTAFIETSEFPKGKVGLTPANECCFGNGSGNVGGKCPVDAKAWQDPVWQALDFQIDEPSLYRYSYESDGKTFTALAVGDADCDTNMATFTLRGTADNGNPAVNLEMPPKGSY